MPDDDIREREPLRQNVKPDISLMRYQADNIPDYDGNPKQLTRFINVCENFIKNFQNSNNLRDPINVCILDTILGKLKNRAADLIYSRSELSTWQSIKDTLQLTFSDQRSIDCLIQELFSLKPWKNETPIQFGMRVQDARSLLHSRLNTEINSVHERTIKIQHYDEFALKTFINGLPYHMQLIVRLRDPNTLEKAIALVMEEENFLYLNSISKTIENPKSHYKPQTNVNQNFPSSIRPVMPVLNFTQNPNQYRTNFQPQFRTQIPYFRTPVPNNNLQRPNFSTNENNQNFRTNSNNPPFYLPRTFLNQNKLNPHSVNVRRNNQLGEPMETDSFRSRSTIVQPPQKRNRTEANFNNEIESEKPSTSVSAKEIPSNSYSHSNVIEDSQQIDKYQLQDTVNSCYNYDPHVQYMCENIPDEYNPYFDNNYDINVDFNNMNIQRECGSIIPDNYEQCENFHKTPNLTNPR